MGVKVQDIELAQAIVEHVDTHLHERMTLDDLVAATHYSKFHLHRAFTTVLGLPVHTYVQRRRLSEAASLLVHSRRSILDIALLSGYQSQQAFSLAFKSLYKQAPGAFRRRADAYPLQCRVSLYAHLAAPIVERQQVRLANDADVPALLALMKAAIDGYPEMDEGAFLRHLQARIRQGQALVLDNEGCLLGALVFSRSSGLLEFLGVHPQFRACGVERCLLDVLTTVHLPAQSLEMTTFRANDKADTGQRALLLSLGFQPRESLVEYGYPTQRLVRLSSLSKEDD